MPGFGVSFRSGTERAFKIPAGTGLSDALAAMTDAGFDHDTVAALASSSALAKSRGNDAPAPEPLTAQEVAQLTALAVTDLLDGKGETQVVRAARHVLRHPTSGKFTPVEATDDAPPDDGEDGDLAAQQQPAFLTGMFRHSGAALPVLRRPRTDSFAQGEDDTGAL